MWPTVRGMVRKLRAFLTDDSGATAIEYCIIATGIALGIIPALHGVGLILNTTFSSLLAQMK